ncbi:hypothetical protein J2T03_000370 [Chryseobacterium lathyri]|nr:hypothetical protein [Chryseobacterium lathyri]
MSDELLEKMYGKLKEIQVYFNVHDKNKPRN